jgi:hypothetical protein
MNIYSYYYLIARSLFGIVPICALKYENAYSINSVSIDCPLASQFIEIQDQRINRLTSNNFYIKVTNTNDLVLYILLCYNYIRYLYYQLPLIHKNF